jgi:hypothetical protein
MSTTEGAIPDENVTEVEGGTVVNADQDDSTDTETEEVVEAEDTDELDADSAQ